MNINCPFCINEELNKLQEIHAMRGFNSSIHAFALRDYLLQSPMKFSLECMHIGIMPEENEREEAVVPLLNAKFPITSTPRDRKIITLVGSTNKAKKLFRQANLALTCKGFIVLSVGDDTHSDEELVEMGQLTATNEELRDLHFDKIRMSNIVYALNPWVCLDNGEILDYVGESMGIEIQLARSLDKELWWYNKHICKKNCPCSR